MNIPLLEFVELWVENFFIPWSLSNNLMIAHGGKGKYHVGTEKGVQVPGEDGGRVWASRCPVGEITYQLVGST